MQPDSTSGIAFSSASTVAGLLIISRKPWHTANEREDLRANAPSDREGMPENSDQPNKGKQKGRFPGPCVAQIRTGLVIRTGGFYFFAHMSHVQPAGCWLALMLHFSHAQPSGCFIHDVHLHPAIVMATAVIATSPSNTDFFFISICSFRVYSFYSSIREPAEYVTGKCVRFLNGDPRLVE